MYKRQDAPQNSVFDPARQVGCLDALKLKALAAPPHAPTPAAAAAVAPPPAAGALPADFAARWRATLAPLAGLAGLWAGVFAELGRAERRAGGPPHLPEAALYRVDLGAAWRFRAPPPPPAAQPPPAGEEEGRGDGAPALRRKRG